MASIQNIELVDDIRKDALLLMKSRPELSYLEAFMLAKDNLIGQAKITEFEFQPFNVDIQIDSKNNEIDSNHVSTNQETSSQTANPVVDDVEKEFYKNEASVISGLIDLDKYNTEQIKSYLIAHRMGVDITKIADVNYSKVQIDFLAVLLASGLPIDKYINNYEFDPKEEFTLVALNSKK